MARCLISDLTHCLASRRPNLVANLGGSEVRIKVIGYSELSRYRLTGLENTQ